MYKPVAESDTDKICAYLAYYRKIYIFIGMAVLVVGVLFLPFLKFFIKESAVPGELNLHLCYLIFLGDAVISYLLYGYMTAIPTAYQRRDILSKVNMVMVLLQCLAKSVSLYVSSEFYLYLLSIPAMTIVRNLVTAYVVRKRYPEIRCRSDLNDVQKHDLKKKVFGLLVDKITAVSRNSIDTLCISAFIGLAVTGIYNNYYYIMAAVISFSTIVLSSMMASVGNSIAAESNAKNYSDMRLFDFIYMALAGWSTVCLLCLYQPFMMVWLGRDMMFGTSVVVVICAYFYILKSGDIRWVYHEGAGLWYECRFIMIGEAVVNIILNVLLCKIWGVLGIILATVLSVFVTNNLFCPQVLFRCYFKNGKLKEYLTDHLSYTLTMLVTAGASWFLCDRMFPMSVEMNRMGYIIILAGRLTVCSVLSVFIFWIIWHRSKRYDDSLRWIQKLRKA